MEKIYQQICYLLIYWSEKKESEIISASSTLKSNGCGEYFGEEKSIFPFSLAYDFSSHGENTKSLIDYAALIL